MYKISEFSKITGLTVKALRYYDDEGLIIPIRDKGNNYRYYNNEDYEKAKIIVMLKEFEFSIVEIKDVLENFKNEEDISVCLLEKQKKILEEIKNKKQVIKKLKEKMLVINKGEIDINYTFEIKEIPEIRVISIRSKTNWESTGDYIGKLYSIAKTTVNGAMTTIYHDGEYKEVSDMEICVPVTNAIYSEGIENKVLPAMKALCTTHIGKYEDLKIAYKALYDYAEKNNITLSEPHREVYNKGPGMVFKGNPDKYETDIIIPVK